MSTNMTVIPMMPFPTHEVWALGIIVLFLHCRVLTALSPDEFTDGIIILSMSNFTKKQ